MLEQREPSIEALRAAPIKFRYQVNGKMRRVLVDSFTAGAILAIYDAANADNQAKLGRMVASSLAQFQRVASLAFDLTSTR